MIVSVVAAAVGQTVCHHGEAVINRDLIRNKMTDRFSVAHENCASTAIAVGIVVTESQRSSSK